MQVGHFGKRSLNPCHFHSRPINSISCESWHIQLKFDALLRLLRLKLQLWEVVELAKVQTKKLIKNSDILNFWAKKTLYTSKESWEQSSFKFEIKAEDSAVKNLKKNGFIDFWSQKILISARSWLDFWKTWKDSRKMTWLPFTWDVYGQSQELLYYISNEW